MTFSFFMECTQWKSVFPLEIKSIRVKIGEQFSLIKGKEKSLHPKSRETQTIENIWNKDGNLEKVFLVIKTKKLP